MARLKHYTHSLASGYLLLVVNSVYSLAIIPLALSYLSGPVFGLWSLVVQIGLFLQLTDLGMTGAFARILIEYKDATDRREYASVIKTMWIVFCLQGVIVALLGWVAAPFIERAFKIEPEHQLMFVAFLRVYLVIFAFGLAAKVFSLTLAAHQRNDLLNLASMISFGAGYLGLWIGFRAGWGLWGMALGYAAMTLVNGLMPLLQAFRAGLLPSGFTRAAFSGARFFEVFNYGKDRFLVMTGSSILQSAPAFLIARFLGLEANAQWTVGTRAYYLCAQLVTRIGDLAYPALAEMYVRKELARLKERFVVIAELAAIGAAVLGVLLIFLNRDFVALLTSGKIEWDSRIDVLLCVWLLTTTAQRAFWLPIGVSLTLGFMRFVYFIEALMMVILVAGLLHWIHSLTGVVLGIIGSSLVASVPYSIRRSGEMLNSTPLALVRQPVTATFVCALPLVAAGYVMSLVSWPEGWGGLITRGLLLGTAGAALMLMRPTVRSSAREMLKKARTRA